MHAGFVRFLRRFVSRLLRGKGSALARTSKTTSACGRLRDQVPLEIRDRDHRVIERRRDMHDAVGNVLLLFLPKDFFLPPAFAITFHSTNRLEFSL